VKYISFDESYFSKDTESSFYWAGFLAADGCLQHVNMKSGKRKNGTQSYSDSYIVRISQNDKEHLELFKKHIGADQRKLTERKYLNRKENTVKINYNLSLRSEIMYQDLHRFGIVEKKSYNLTMPDWLCNHNLVHHYIRGYFDGDGSIFFSGTKPTIDIVGTFDFLKSVRSVLLRDIEFESNVRIVRNHTARLVWGGSKITSKIASWMYRDCTICLPRKYEKVQSIA
jgi:hypothetical protein